MMRFGKAIVTLAIWVVLWPEVQLATACVDTEVVDNIVGVDENGRFLLHRYMTGGSQCHEEEFWVHDADGRVIARYHSNSIDSNDCQNSWTGEGALPVAAVSVETTDSLLRRLKHAMGVTPLRKSHNRVVVEQSPPTCMRAWLILPLGWYPVWTVAEMDFGDCREVKITPKTHPHTPLVFLTYSYVSGTSCTHSEKSVHWVHPGLIEAITWLRRAQVLFKKGKFGASENAAIRSLQHYSGLIEARVVLARSLLKQHVPFDEARHKMAFEFQPHFPCKMGGFLEYVGRLYEEEFQEWHQLPDFEIWLDALGEKHEQAHLAEQNPLNSWGPNSE